MKVDEVFLVSLLGIPLCLSLALVPPPNRKHTGHDVVNGRNVTARIFLDNPLDRGEWHPPDLCVPGSFTTGFHVKFEPKGHVDETALNAIRMSCQTTTGGSQPDIISVEGSYGNWYPSSTERLHCNNSTRISFITDVRAQILEDQGTFTDDVGMQNVEFSCKYGKQMARPYFEFDSSTRDFKDGTWSKLYRCPKRLEVQSAICGIQARLEEKGAFDDDCAITDAVFFCCPLPDGFDNLS